MKISSRVPLGAPRGESSSATAQRRGREPCALRDRCPGSDVWAEIATSRYIHEVEVLRVALNVFRQPPAGFLNPHPLHHLPNCSPIQMEEDNKREKYMMRGICDDGFLRFQTTLHIPTKQSHLMSRELLDMIRHEDSTSTRRSQELDPREMGKDGYRRRSRRIKW